MILRSKFRDFIPIFLLFIITNGLFVTGSTFLDKWGVSQNVIIAGNLFLFLITLFSFLLAKRGLQHENPHAFVRAFYTSFIIKFFLCTIAAFIYISINKGDLNKPAFFACMFLYLVYTGIEVAVLTRMLKTRKNA